MRRGSILEPWRFHSQSRIPWQCSDKPGVTASRRTDSQREKLSKNLRFLSFLDCLKRFYDHNAEYHFSACWLRTGHCLNVRASKQLLNGSHTPFFHPSHHLRLQLTFSILAPALCRGTGFFVVGTLGGGRWGTSAGPACGPWKDRDFVMLGTGSGLVNVWFRVGAGFSASSCNPEKQNQSVSWQENTSFYSHVFQNVHV